MSSYSHRYTLPLLLVLFPAGCEDKAHDLARAMALQQRIATRYQIEQVGVMVGSEELVITLQNSRYNRLGSDVQRSLAIRIAKLARQVTASDRSGRFKNVSFTIVFIEQRSKAGGIVTIKRTMGSYTFEVEDLDRPERK